MAEKKEKNFFGSKEFGTAVRKRKKQLDDAAGTAPRKKTKTVARATTKAPVKGKTATRARKPVKRIV